MIAPAVVASLGLVVEAVLIQQAAHQIGLVSIGFYIPVYDGFIALTVNWLPPPQLHRPTPLTNPHWKNFWKKHYCKPPELSKKHRNSKKEYSVRANVERTIAHLTRHGARQTRLVGIAWNNFKLAIHGVLKI
jgi:hypothetical protein